MLEGTTSAIAEPSRSALRAVPRRTVESVDPATGEVWRSYASFGPAEVRAAMEAARHAQPLWAVRSLKDRARVLRSFRRVLYRRRKEVADLIRRENGRPATEALASEVMVTLDLAAMNARLASRELATETIVPRNPALWRKRVQISHEPLGVVAVISPWNYPLMLSAGIVLPAIVAGNAVLLKPSELTPAVGLMLGELLREAGLPAGVMHVCVGDGATGAAIVDAGVDKVFFTGSVATGRRVAVACGERLIPCALELGGSDPAIVLEDADVDVAASGIAWGRFNNAGQTCVAPKRVFVVDSVHDRFVQSLARTVASLHVGPSDLADTDVGPMIRPSQVSLLREQLRDALARGASIAGGQGGESGIAPGAEPDRFFAPTVLGDATPAMRVAKEETFGPLLPVFRVRDAEEAIAMANSSEFGLSASVWGRDLDRAMEVARRLETGSVEVNDAITVPGIVEAPHSGVKSSGFGASHGRFGLRECVRPRAIVTDWLPAVRQPWWFGYDADRERNMDGFLRFWYGTTLRERVSGIVPALKLLFRQQRPL